MKRFQPVIWPLLVAFLVGPPTPSPVQAQPRPTLTVSAAASLKDVLERVNAQFSGANVQMNYGSSGSLQRQIEQGAPVDVFVAAARKNMDQLAAARLVEAAGRRDVASNRLVLVVPTGDSNLTSFRQLSGSAVKRVAMGEPGSVPAGSYARELLTRLHIYEAVAVKAVLGKDVRSVLTQVELGNVDAGIVYRTDALSSSRVRIVAQAPLQMHKAIVYPAAVVTASRKPDLARRYLRFLSGPQARATFLKFGFGLPRRSS